MPSKVVSPAEWLTARKALLLEEKALTRANDALTEKLKELPMVKLDKTYAFPGANGPATLADLFDGRKQLIVYHYMFAPEDKGACTGCSFQVDNLPFHLEHLNSKDTALVMVSRAPYEKIKAFKQRMGWPFLWVSSYGGDFNWDFHVSNDVDVAPVMYNYKTKEGMKGEGPGLSVFFKEGDEIFHTYSTYARGLDSTLVTHKLLDMTPLGRQDNGVDWKFHDEYDTQKETKASH